jgi:hypothetical protein
VSTTGTGIGPNVICQGSFVQAPADDDQAFVTASGQFSYRSANIAIGYNHALLTPSSPARPATSRAGRSCRTPTAPPSPTTAPVTACLSASRTLRPSDQGGDHENYCPASYPDTNAHSSRPYCSAGSRRIPHRTVCPQRHRDCRSGRQRLHSLHRRRLGSCQRSGETRSVGRVRSLGNSWPKQRRYLHDLHEPWMGRRGPVRVRRLPRPIHVAMSGPDCQPDLPGGISRFNRFGSELE